MDQLPALGTSIAQTVMPTYKIYESILRKRAAEIKSTDRKTFSFGSDARQMLDVYRPSSASNEVAKCPILMFLYGGGLVNGSKMSPLIEDDLVYANLGHYFAEKHGFVVVIPDYRLVPQARFPSGGEDLDLAIDWVRSNLDQLGGSEHTRDLFLMGNSAGGVHVSTWMWGPTFAQSRKRVLGQGVDNLLRLKGVILVAVPFHFQAAEGGREEVLITYYGDRRAEDCPQGLWQAFQKRGNLSELLPGVHFLVLTATLDPEEEILQPNRDFLATWDVEGPAAKSNLHTFLMENHNHISPVLALGTGISKEEAWGEQVADFCRSANGRNE